MKKVNMNILKEAEIHENTVYWEGGRDKESSKRRLVKEERTEL